MRRPLPILFAILLTACSESPTSPGKVVVTVTTVYQSGQSGVTAPRVEKISTTVRLEEVWAEILRGGVRPVPVIDFERNDVILVARGQTGSSSCESVEIERVTLSDVLEVAVANVSSREGVCPCTADIGHPVHLVSIAKTRRDVISSVRAVTRPCS